MSPIPDETVLFGTAHSGQPIRMGLVVFSVLALVAMGTWGAFLVWLFLTLFGLQ